MTPGMLQPRVLGRSGLLVSPIGLGTVALGRLRGLKYPGQARAALPSDDAVLELFRAARELGVNLIDTAPAYGLSEARIGAILSRAGWLGGRERWIICTKAGEEFDDDVGESRFDFSPPALRASVERSLRRLNVDELDAVLLHSDGRDEWIIARSGAMDALKDLRQRGLVRAVGISTKTPEGGLLGVQQSDLVMVTLNPAEWDSLPVIAAAHAANIGVLIKKPLGSGRLSPHECLPLALTTPGVGSVVVGTTSPDHLRQAVEIAAQHHPLTPSLTPTTPSAPL